MLNYLELQPDSDSQKDAKRLRRIMITDNEWTLILDLTEILSRFADATDYLGGSKYCTYSSINPTIIELMKWVRPASYNNNSIDTNMIDRTIDAFGEVSEPAEKEKIDMPVETHNLLNQIKKDLYEALIHYFDPMSSEALLAAILDPRFKKLTSFTQSQKQEAEYQLKSTYDNMKLNQHSNASPLPAVSSQQRKRRSLFDAFTQPSTAENQVSEYLILEEIPFEKDPYTW